MQTKERRAPERDWKSILAAVLLAGLLIAFTAWRAIDQTEAVESLPSTERRALYARTKESLETVCRAPTAGLADFCREQAEMLLRFPECDADCRALAETQRSRSAR